MNGVHEEVVERRGFLAAFAGLAALPLVANAAAPLVDPPTVGATEVHFTPSELSELNAAVVAIDIKGARLPDAVLLYSGREAPMRK